MIFFLIFWSFDLGLLFSLKQPVGQVLLLHVGFKFAPNSNCYTNDGSIVDILCFTSEIERIECVIYMSEPTYLSKNLGKNFPGAA